MARKMPPQKPGKSVQSVGTPINFLDAVRYRLRIVDFAIDLAADKHNRVVKPFYSVEDDALVQPWHQVCGLGKGWAWLNPEFGAIYPWAEKCWEESQLGAQVAMLVPAAVGSHWWADFVRGHGYATFLQNRIQFIGHPTLYPKDLALILYAPFIAGGDTTWRWNQGSRKKKNPEPSERSRIAEWKIKSLLRSQTKALLVIP